MLPTHILGLLLLGQNGAAAAEKDPSKLGQKHGCTVDGRYWVHHDKGKKVYCWEGAGFSEDAAPPFVKSYFEPSPSGDSSTSSGASDVPFSPVGSTPKVAAPGGGGAGGGNGSGGGGSANPKTTTFSSAPQQGIAVDLRGNSSSGAKVRDALRDLSRDPGAGSNAAAGGRREPDPVNPQALAGIETGMQRATVLDRLGEPHGKILNTGDEGSLEIWTYVIRGGGFGSVRMENGKVIKVVRPR